MFGKEKVLFDQILFWACLTEIPKIPLKALEM